MPIKLIIIVGVVVVYLPNNSFYNDAEFKNDFVRRQKSLFCLNYLSNQSTLIQPFAYLPTKYNSMFFLKTFKNVTENFGNLEIKWYKFNI